MSLEQVVSYLDARGYADRVRTFEVSSATVELAAQAVGVPPAQIAKTLSFRAGERVVLVVAAGDAKVNSSKFKKAFGAKGCMLGMTRSRVWWAIPWAVCAPSPCVRAWRCGSTSRCAGLPRSTRPPARLQVRCASRPTSFRMPAAMPLPAGAMCASCQGRRLWVSSVAVRDGSLRSCNCAGLSFGHRKSRREALTHCSWLAPRDIDGPLFGRWRRWLPCST